MTPIKKVSIVACLVAVASLACDDSDKDKECNPDTEKGCSGGQVCEVVANGKPACFAPVEVQGRVYNSTSNAAISGAAIVALDANGGARSDVASSGMDGTYKLAVPAQRDGNGVPVATAITLRADASGFQGFPRAPRTALPIELASAAKQMDVLAVKNATTDIALIPLADPNAAGGTITGKVDHADGGGVLIVADQGGKAASTAISGRNGAFTMFNVAAGATKVEGYRAGLTVTPADVTVTAGQTSNVTLAANVEGLGSVAGSVNIVNAPGGAVTSVILVVESTFDATAVRGAAPAGLRAAGLSGAFMIEKVPAGKYVVLAAFENDNLVRDPDESQGGTDIVHITVAAGAAVTNLPSFKVTEHLAVVSPGAEAPTVVPAGDPTFTWVDDSGEDGYELRVFDALGNMVHENTAVPRVTGDTNVSYQWVGANLRPGMYYQFRAWSYAGAAGKRTLHAATEDLRGVFVYAPPM